MLPLSYHCESGINNWTQLHYDIHKVCGDFIILTESVLKIKVKYAAAHVYPVSTRNKNQVLKQNEMQYYINLF